LVRFTVLQPGRSPLDGIAPTITIRNGDALETFAAKPAGKPGVYRASVTFPSAGTWTYEVDDGFIAGQPHTFPPVEIGGGVAGGPADSRTGGPQAGDDGGGGSLVWLAIPGGALLLAAGFLLARDRQRRHHQPQAA
jgi:hypothetical protein